ncbi:hypothetical protein BGZ51_006655 [Haplosporangium sp. Z 767]|nr:hypothetical protein BGZ51_006655 [Haplosporangium sp. Z 767]KAF9183168.1 hypothetical protein BGZ50_004414 [Haplosporangium sp. Z 11]
MHLRLKYNWTKPFNKAYSAIIAFVFAICLAVIALWTVATKKDCVPYTSSVYIKDKCQPYNLFDGVEVRQSRDGIKPFVYRDTIAGISQDYKYRSNNYSCPTMNYYRIVRNPDRSTQINYNVSCSFDDNVNFTLIASTLSNDVGFGWDADPDVRCTNGEPSLLLWTVFAINDEETNPSGVWYGLNLDLDCKIDVWHDAKHNIAVWLPEDKWDLEKVQMSLHDYGLHKRTMAKKFAVNKDMKFVVGYTCSACSTKSGWDLVLTLLITLGSVGGIVYTILIFVAETIYVRSSDTKKYNTIDLDNVAPDHIGINCGIN